MNHIVEFENQLSTEIRHSYQQFLSQLNKIGNCQTQLLHLATVVKTCGAVPLSLYRDKLTLLMKDHMDVQSIHFVSFDGSGQYRRFWKNMQGALKPQDSSILFCRRNYGTIDYLCCDRVRNWLKMDSYPYVKSIGKFSFVYVELRPGFLEYGAFQNDYSLLKLVFDLYLEQDINQIHKLLCAFSQELCRQFKKLSSLISDRFLPSCLMQNNVAVVPNNPILSLLLTIKYNEAYEITKFFQAIHFNQASAKKEYRKVILKDQKLVYCHHFYTSGLETFEYMFDATLRSMIELTHYPKRAIETIMEKSIIPGTHFSDQKDWSMVVDATTHSVTIEISNKRTTNKSQSYRKTQILKQLLSHGQSSIGNEFIPDEVDMNKTRRSRKATKKVTVKVQPSKNILSFKIQFNQQVDITKVSSIDFNILNHSVNTACNITNQIIKQRFKDMSFNTDKLCKFIQKVAFKYQKRSNPFHNFYHGFTVFHGAYMLTLNSHFKLNFNQNDSFCFMISALCHDLSHTGFTNSYQEKICSKLANRFGDRSILQNNSIAKALKLITDEQTNFIVEMRQAEWKSFRKLLVESILATDNKHHTSVLSAFDSIVSEQKQVDCSNQQTKQKIIGALLHCCDFWGNVKQYRVSKAWSDRVNQQFSNQYKMELQLGVQPTPYFKNLECMKVVAKNQSVFISAIVYPLYKKVNEWLGGYLEVCVKSMEKNLSIWKRVQEGKSIEPTKNGQ